MYRICLSRATALDRYVDPGKFPAKVYKGTEFVKHISLADLKALVTYGVLNEVTVSRQQVNALRKSMRLRGWYKEKSSTTYAIEEYVEASQWRYTITYPTRKAWIRAVAQHKSAGWRERTTLLGLRFPIPRENHVRVFRYLAVKVQVGTNERMSRKIARSVEHDFTPGALQPCRVFSASALVRCPVTLAYGCVGDTVFIGTREHVQQQLDKAVSKL